MAKKKRGGKRPGAGRPKSPKSKRKTVIIQFRLTEREAAPIRRKAKARKLSVPEWCREKILS